MAFVQYFIRQLTSELELAVSAVELYDNSLRVSLKIAAPPCSARAAALGALTADAQTEVTCCHNNSLQKREVLRLGRKSQGVLTSASVSFLSHSRDIPFALWQFRVFLCVLMLRDLICLHTYNANTSIVICKLCACLFGQIGSGCFHRTVSLYDLL